MYTRVCTGIWRPQVDILCLFQFCSVFFIRDLFLNLPESWPIYPLLPSLLMQRSSNLCLPKAKIAGRLPQVLDFYFLTSKLKPLCLHGKYFIHWVNPKFCSFFFGEVYGPQPAMCLQNRTQTHSSADHPGCCKPASPLSVRAERPSSLKKLEPPYSRRRGLTKPVQWFVKSANICLLT